MALQLESKQQKNLKEAKALDNAMKQLENQVNQDPAITSSSKFENEDTEQQKHITTL